MATDCGYFDKFEALVDKYMPMRGEGETAASQIVTAVNKLIYKWYNDGDVFEGLTSAKPSSYSILTPSTVITL